MSNFDPEPKPRKDGGTDYKVDHCENVCYWHDKKGCYVSQCPALKVTVKGMSCEIDCEH